MLAVREEVQLVERSEGEFMVQRYRATFAILEPMRYTGHLDLLRTWERTIRRAGLPLAYSGGYHAHPRIQIAAALPLGCTACAELLDLWLEQGVSEGEVRVALEKSLPAGLGLRLLVGLSSPHGDLQDRVVAGDYTATAYGAGFPVDVAERVARLLGSRSVPRERRGRSYDLRPLIWDLRVLSSRPSLSLLMRLRLREGGTGRPDEVLACLDLGGFGVLVSRDRLLLQSPGQDLIASDG